MYISITKDGEIEINSKIERPKRKHKGKSLLESLDSLSEYIVLDLETTGLDSCFDEIIEIAAIRIKDGKPTESFTTLVKPHLEIDEFITKLTGITNDMLSTAPTLKEVLPNLLNFVGNAIIVGHNVNFDINFIYDAVIGNNLGYFSNDFVDTFRIAKKCNLPVENNKLSTLANFFNIQQSIAHRATADCETTHELYVKLKEYIKINNIELSQYQSLKLSDIHSTTDNINTDNPFFGKVVAFTGTLESMQRKDAAQIVANLGGILGEGVTKSTNFLVLGNFDYCSTITNGKSSKHKKAEQLILKGQDLQIISESVFLTMIEAN